mmetsp:Transcript_6516/g.18309  ORF Transcript_6516/g.18309 Transcript_6516/m.18309 type:complete len:161 (-) Transcript_6516:2803-3285(-)
MPAAAPQPQAGGKMRGGLHWFPSLPFQQVQVLFDSALARLCIFPSRYLYAIGLPPVFSLRWNLPPVGAAIPNNSTRRNIGSLAGVEIVLYGGMSSMDVRESHPLCCPVPGDLIQWPFKSFKHTRTVLQTTIRHKCRFTIWAIGASLAVTGPILVSFFSSA